jgi:hypothetical protein
MDDPRLPLLAEALRRGASYRYRRDRWHVALAETTLAALPAVGLVLVTKDALDRANLSAQQMLDLFAAQSAEPTE